MNKILSIDGGGIKGVFPASFLATIEDSTGKKICNHFDLIIGTSTGGIIALALALGIPAKEILSFYEKHGPDIFKGNKILGLFRRIFRAKYSNRELRLSLEEVFGDSLLGDAKTRILIPSVNIDTGEVHVWKTAHHERFERDYKEKMVDVALATSAAPTYFATYINSSGIPLVDGGLWANNPMSYAITEAIGVLEWKREDIQILGLGCTTEPTKTFSARKKSKGLGYWGLNMFDLILSTQSSASLGASQLIIGRENVFRVSPVVANSRFGLDDISSVQELKSLGISEARKELPRVRHFFDNKVDVFKPYHLL